MIFNRERSEVAPVDICEFRLNRRIFMEVIEQTDRKIKDINFFNFRWKVLINQSHKILNFIWKVLKIDKL